MDVHAQVERRMSRKLVGALGVHPFRPDGQQSLERLRLGRRVGVEVVLLYQLGHQLALVRARRGLSVAWHDEGGRRVREPHLSGQVRVSTLTDTSPCSLAGRAAAWAEARALEAAAWAASSTTDMGLANASIEPMTLGRGRASLCLSWCSFIIYSRWSA